MKQSPHRVSGNFPHANLLAGRTLAKAFRVLTVSFYRFLSKVRASREQNDPTKFQVSRLRSGAPCCRNPSNCLAFFTSEMGGTKRQPWAIETRPTSVHFAVRSQQRQFPSQNPRSASEDPFPIEVYTRKTSALKLHSGCTGRFHARVCGVREAPGCPLGVSSPLVSHNIETGFFIRRKLPRPRSHCALTRETTVLLRWFTDGDVVIFTRTSLIPDTLTHPPN